MEINYSKSIYDVHYLTQKKSSADGYEIVLGSQVKGTIRYTVDETEPTNKSPEFLNGFSPAKTTTVKAALFIDGKIAGAVLKKEFIVSMASGRKVTFNEAPSKYYNSLETFGLVNGVLESPSIRRDLCTGWRNEDANFTVDLGENKEVKKVTLYFLQDGKNFIVQPKSLTVYYTIDGSRYKMAGKAKFSYSGEDYMKMEVIFEPFTSNLIKIRAENPGKITAGKLSHNEDLWLLLDEVVIE
jgi:hexosaminidase